jgi:hypothetical protein
VGEASFEQNMSQSRAAHIWLDKEQSQLGGVGQRAGAKDGSQTAGPVMRDPGSFLGVVPIADKTL